MDLYHCAPLRLGEGSIIEPGNWGRMHKFHAWQDAVLVRDYKEMAVEFARQVLNPSAPSRLNCVFALETEQDARAYLAKHAPMSVLHLVEPVALGDQPLSLFRTKWSQLDVVVLEGVSPLQALERDIQRYWQGNPDTDVEVLIGGPVRVLHAL